MSFVRMFAVSLAVLVGSAVSVFAADRVKLEDFLETTGFDVALESIRLSAESAPQMIGVAPEAFGSEWRRLANEVFDTTVMHELALDILEETLEEDLLDHAAAFYASDFGQRIVEAENASHLLEDDTLKSESGAAILDALERIESPRLDYLNRMNAASGSAESSVRAIQEIQVRFIMAASGAGVIDLRMDEPDLREALRADEGALLQSIQASALEGAAYTYQSFSDEETLLYAEALEHPKMREVYELMNAVQYEVMANRFEALAGAMTRLRPSQEL